MYGVLLPGSTTVTCRLTLPQTGVIFATRFGWCHERSKLHPAYFGTGTVRNAKMACHPLQIEGTVAQSEPNPHLRLERPPSQIDNHEKVRKRDRNIGEQDEDPNGRSGRDHNIRT